MNILTLSTLLAFVSTVLAAASDSQARFDGYFAWSATSLSAFVIATILGLCTLCVGGFWIWRRYGPTAGATPVGRLQLGTVWAVWIFSIIFYVLTACWSAMSAHAPTLNDINETRSLVLQARNVEYASWAFVSVATTGWMFLLLSHSLILEKIASGEALPQSKKKMIKSIFFFLFNFTTKNMNLQWAVSLLLLSITLGGIILPATQVVFAQMLYLGVNALASLFLFFCILIIRGKTLAVGKSDPLKLVLFVCVPMWMVTGLLHLLFAILAVVQNTRSSVGFLVTTSAFYASSFATLQMLPKVTVGIGGGKLEV
ncbi:hypothetical protein DL96DRAFT_1706144 [Flagelloscypha sp. PMI_526]|nr:hypothetical protein DL96DRAFT_1706144 [Flagelloscypha sp. PMI_526]